MRVSVSIEQALVDCLPVPHAEDLLHFSRVGQPFVDRAVDRVVHVKRPLPRAPGRAGQGRLDQRAGLRCEPSCHEDALQVGPLVLEEAGDRARDQGLDGTLCDDEAEAHR